MRNRIAIEGIDGSGKSSVVSAITEALTAEGLHVRTFATFRIANTELGHDIYDLWADDRTAKIGIEVMRHTLGVCETIAAKDGADVVIYDRHWMSVMTEIDNRPNLIQVWGNDYFVPACLLRTPPETGRSRLQNDQDEEFSSLTSLTTYANKFNQLARTFPQQMLGIYRSDDDVTIDDIARNIMWDMRIRR